jgi:tetratricopeptide (TPR) repeat protein
MDYQKIQEQVQELIKAGDYEALVDLYTDALQYDFPESIQGEFMSGLGELYNHFGKKQEALDHYNGALGIFRDAESAEGKGEYFAVIAAVANNLGILHEEMNDHKNAADRFKEALEHYQALAGNNAEAYQPYVGTTMYNLGNLFAKQKDFYQSRKYFQEAYEVFRELADEKPEYFQAYAANTLISLGNSYIEEHDYQQAELYFKKAVPIYRTLSAQAFENFGPYLAATLNNLAVASKNTKQQPKAVEFYQETLELYQKLSDTNPALFQPYEAATLNSMGILFSEMFDKAEAEKYYEQAIEKYQQLADRQPDNFNPYLATSIHNLAILHDDKGELEKAETTYHKALYIRKIMAEKYPNAFDRDVCVTAMNLVTLYQQFLEQQQKDEFREKAKAQLEDIKTRLEKYDKSAPVIQSLWSDYEYFAHFFETATAEDLSVANAIRQVAGISEEINSTIDPAEKAGFQQQIIQLLEEQMTVYPENDKLKESMSTELGNMAWLKIRLKDIEQAKTLTEKAMQINPRAYWVKLNHYYHALIENEKEKAQSVLQEILDACSTDIEKQKVKEQVDRDLMKLKIDGFSL